MFGLLKDKLGDLTATAGRFRDKETAEAIVAIMTGTAFADGELEEAEKKKMVAAFRTHPILSQYDAAILTRKHEELASQFGLDTDLGLDACLKELRDVGSKAPAEKRQTILRLGVASAKADGEIEPAERAFLSRCADALGVSLADVGL